MARGGMDYGFFQLLSDKLEHAKPDEAQKLTDLRSKLLDLTHEIDEAIKIQTEEAHKVLDEILGAPDIGIAAQKALPKMTQVFVEILKGELQAAQKSKDQAKLEKLAKIATVIQSASTSNAYIGLIETLLQAPDDKSVEEALNEVKDLINEDFLQFINGLTNQLETHNDQPEVLQRLKEINRIVLRVSMQKNLEEKL
jgi:transcription termination factor NusB